MSNKGHTPQRTVRIPDEIWDSAMETAARRGESLSNVIRAAVEAYAADPEKFIRCLDT